MRQTDAIYGIHKFNERQKSANAGNGVSYFMVEGDSFLLSSVDRVKLLTTATVRTGERVVRDIGKSQPGKRYRGLYRN